RVRPGCRTATVIAYFDTSAIVPLLIDEIGTPAAGQIWDQAERLVSVRLSYVESRAALAQAARIDRISQRHVRSAVRDLEGLLDQLDMVDIDVQLMRKAGELAEDRGLRAYDAVHLAAAVRIQDPDLVVVAGDRALLAAAEALGMSVAAIA
ncbi:MAG TPA: type II toxin-antitoxin system VapC family toxin, partial [Nocardioides sp.]